jgi:hypothetical protein
MEISRRRASLVFSISTSAGAAANRFAYHGSIGATKRQRRLLQYSVPMGAHTHCTAGGKKKKYYTRSLSVLYDFFLSSL